MTEANQEQVIQADREAAAALVEWHNKAASDWRPNLQFFASDMPDGIRKGVWDNHEIVQAFARHRRLHTPETAGERLLIEHFKRMMDAAANYVEPTVYIARHPDLNVIGDCTWVREFPEPNQQQSETGVAATKQRRDQAFIRDMLYMLDGPEQRAALSTRPPEVEALVEAAAELLAGMSSTYTARNGREMGIEADDGEKCWIVHSDLIAHLKGALSRIKETGNG